MFFRVIYVIINVWQHKFVKISIKLKTDKRKRKNKCKHELNNCKFEVYNQDYVLYIFQFPKKKKTLHHYNL